MNINVTIIRMVRLIALIVLGLVYLSVNHSPATAQGFSISFSRPEFVVSPGDNLTGTIPVTNVEDEPVSVRIYLADRIRNPEKTSDYDFDMDGGNEPRTILNWMTFTPERMTLEPEEVRDIIWEVNIPDDPTLEGSYWGVIFIEGIPSEEPDVVPGSEGAMAIGIVTIFRYAIQIFATFEGTETRDATFTALNMEPAEGGIDAVAVLENRGNIYIKPIVWLEMTDISGAMVFTQNHSEQTVLPESARDYLFELRNLPIESGEYMVMIYADYGVATLIAAQGRVTLNITPPPAPEEEEPVEVEEPVETEDEPVVEEPEEEPVVEEPEESE